MGGETYIDIHKTVRFDFFEVITIYFLHPLTLSYMEVIDV